MNILEIIDKVRHKERLLEKEIKFIFDGYLKTKEIKDYQMSALCMAIVINGLDLENTFLFTKEMLNSGITIDFPGIKGIIIDKHSTGGVGDRISLALLPICAALGIKVAKLSGRGLGHTGGTIDKMESVGMKITLTREQYLKQLKQVGIFDMAQSENIVPADKQVYALRNSSATVESLELIASSILSKKLALKTKYVFIDIKVGDGALVKTLTDAKKLANIMLFIFKRFNRNVVIHITDMSQPLGRSIGNALEMRATVNTLNNDFETNEFKELIYTFIGDILITTKIAKDKTTAFNKISEVIKNKKALNKFYE
jgi:pyrimidine-nucleoside phosphorylase